MSGHVPTDREKRLGEFVDDTNSRILAVPNWSVGRERQLVRHIRDLLEQSGVALHFCEADIDHNRTVTAFSGPTNMVVSTLAALCELILPAADLQRHVGVHPRIGALDVCPFIVLPGMATVEIANGVAHRFGSWLSETWDVPVFYYEKSSLSGNRTSLAALRKGGFGGMLDREIQPDAGPCHVHPHLGASVVGVRDFLIAMNVNLRTPARQISERIAHDIRERRRAKEPRFQGVMALGLPLASRDMTQVSLNLTRPSETPPDDVVEWVREQAARLGAEVAYAELIGVVRSVDTARCHQLAPRPEQIVEWAS